MISYKLRDSSWRDFLKDISFEIKPKDDDDQQRSKTVMHARNYRIVGSQYIEELGEYHYLVLPKFIEYINENVLHEHNKKDMFQTCLSHLSQLSRRMISDLAE